MEINILSHMICVYNYNELVKRIVIFFLVPALAKLASTSLETCSSAFPTGVPKFIRLSMAPSTCEELSFSKISKRSESLSSSASN